MKTTTWTMAALLAAGTAWGYDWPASGTATLTTDDCDANGEVVVTDDDYAAANGLAGISVGSGVKLVFNTAQAPTVALSGTGGTFVKRGDAEWTLSTAQPNFNGDWVLEGGVSIANVATCSFGANSSSYALYVKSGASFTVSKDVVGTWMLQHRKLHLAGTGYQNKGAYYSLGDAANTGGPWKDVILDDDATIRLDNGYVFVYGSTYEFNGHTCTVLGTKNIYFFTGKFQNGKLVMGDGTDKPLLYLRTSHKTVDTDFEVVLNHGSSLYYYNEPPAFHGRITVNGTVTYGHSHQSGDVCVEDGTTVNLAGSVHLARSDSVLKCVISSQPTTASQPKMHDPHLLKISGYVYGPGGITVAVGGLCEKSLVLSCPTNAFTGPVTVTSGDLRLLDHGAIPDYAQVTVADGASVTAVMPAEGTAWTTAKLVDLQKMACSDAGVCIVDRTASGDAEELVFAAADLEAAGTPAQLHTGVKPADGTIAVTGDFTKAFQPVAWGDNEVAVAGAVPRLASVKITTGARTLTGTLAVTNAGALAFDYPYYVGTQGGARDVRLENATVTMEGLRQKFTSLKDSEFYCKDFTSNAVIVGSYDSTKIVAHPGRLAIGEGCVITARCMCAYGYGSGARQTSGAIVQTGGETCFLGSPDDSYGAYWGYWAPCAVTLAGGKMTWRGYHQFANGGEGAGDCTFLQTGGEFYSRGFDADSACFVDVGRSGAVRARWLQTGGTSHFYGNILLARSSDSQASITAMGSNTLFIAEKGVSWGYDRRQNPVLAIREGAVYQGTLTTSRHTSKEYAVKGFWGVFNCYVDGGWIKCNYSPLGTLGHREDPTSASNYGPTRIASAGAGLGLDVDKGYTGEALVPVHSVAGNGVAGVKGGWTRLETDFMGSPVVEILGDGTNATAFALMDGGAITNVLVTNPGENYTVATAKVATAMSTSGSLTYSYFECALAPNVPGGLNKRGAGMMKLYATNDYTGVTRVLEGTLRLAYPDVVSSASALSVEGGVFDFGGKHNAFRAVGGTGGKITGCSEAELAVETLLAGTTADLVFDGVALRVTGEFALTGADLLAGRAPAYATSIAFADGAGVRLADLTGLDPEKRGGYEILTTTGALTGAKILNADELPPGWRLKATDHALKCVHSNGTALILR